MSEDRDRLGNWGGEGMNEWDAWMHIQGSGGQEGVGGIDEQMQLCGT